MNSVGCNSETDVPSIVAEAINRSCFDLCSSKVTVCKKCGGYSYNGQTCVNSNENVPNKHIRIKDSAFACCPCCQSVTQLKKCKKKLIKQTLERQNPLMTGPFASKLIRLFLPGNKNKAPAIVGYYSDGSPKYGPPGGASNITGYTENGEPIYLPGTGGPDDKGYIMGYLPDGTPIYPPPNVPLKQAMTIIGQYVKDGSPLVGHSKLLHGIIMKGKNSEGIPKYISIDEKTSSQNKLQTQKTVEKKKTGHKKGKTNEALQKFYPRCQYHPACLSENKAVSEKMAWNWKKYDNSCESSKLAFWIPPKYKPGAVAKPVAKIIKKHRLCSPMNCPSWPLPKCSCTACDCHNCEKHKALKVRMQLEFGHTKMFK